MLRAVARVEHCVENLRFSQFTHQKWCTIKSTQGGKMQSNSKKFTFDGGAATYLGTAILGILITVFSLGICYPFAVVLRQRWRAKHSYIDGKQLIFTGSAVGLFGHWIKWFVLIINIKLAPRHQACCRNL